MPRHRYAMIAAWLLASRPAVAQPAAPPPELDAFLSVTDTNKDGKIDRAEWVAAGHREQGFDFLDADGSGTLDRAEVSRGLALLRSRAQGAAPGPVPPK